jgi:hypothetical protein
MADADHETTIIPYGRAALVPDARGEPVVAVRAGRALRLSDGPYPFPEPPDLIGLSSRAERLEILREHLQALCGVWDRPAHGFIAAYFRWIGAAIAAGEAELAALAQRAGGLFAPADWSFAALRPLPQAHLPVAGAAVRVDFAFWTGAGLVAIDLQGSASPRRQRQEELASLAGQGVVIVVLPGAALQAAGEAQFDRLLPAPFHRFWRGVALPSGPFGPQALDEILPEAGQSVASIT